MLSNAPHAQSRPFLIYLIVTSLTCGALVMVIEVLGSRVIGPFFGASLFVWTALITVTLVALASGYSLGGIVSDRRSSPGWLYGIILAAGILTMLVPLLKVMVLKLTLPMGIRLGTLAASALLFGPPLLLLGCVSPFIIKISAREIKSIGRTVGLFSAISTVGSFLGTVLTGFVLIAFFPVNQIFQVVGGLLILLAAGYFVAFRKKWQMALLILLPFLIPHNKAVVDKVLPSGTTVSRIAMKDGFYGNLQVHHYAYGNLKKREMVIDGCIQGGMDMVSGLSVYPYPYFLQYVPYTLNPNGKRCLVIGLGAGLIPRWYEQQGIVTDVVDIDPDVFAMAREYFGFKISGSSYVADARYFLNTTDKKYDYIVMDVFNGESAPVHILSRESLQALKSRLTPGGILGLNLAGNIRGDTFVTASIIKTLKEAFSTVRVYPTFDAEESGGVGNLEVFADNRPPQDLDLAAIARHPVSPLATNPAAFLKQPFTFPENAPSIILTDNYNPIDFFDIKTKEFIRRQIIKGIDLDILAG